MTSLRPFAALALLCALAALAACADGRSGYPSVAPRPIEREAMQVRLVPAAAASSPAGEAAAAALPPSADIAQVVARARAADAAFRAALDEARPRIEAGRLAPAGSEAWVEGQQAYSDAEAARAPVGDALAELDRRRQAATDAGAVAEQAAIGEAMLEIQALDEAEQALLTALSPG